MELVPGAIIGGRYRVERRLGAGGVGEVWAGVALEDGSKVAIKSLLGYAKTHREHVARFKREANFLARVRSPNVARVLDFLSDETHGLLLVLELIDGEPLNLVLRRVQLSVEVALDVAGDVLGAVVELHRQRIIHRDLKPGNIILQTLPTGKKRAVIVDFGISRLAGLDQDGEEITALTRADIAVGTMEYMAPEQILDARSVTGAADIYAVGAMLYRAVAGHHVFSDRGDAELARHKMIVDPPHLATGRTDPLAQGFEMIVMRMIQRKPGDRYQRAEDVLADLTALRTGTFQAEEATAPVPSSPAWPPPDSAPASAAATLGIPPPSHASQPSTSGATPLWRDEPSPSPRRGGPVLMIVAVLAVLGSAAAFGVFMFRQRALSEDTTSAVLPAPPDPDEATATQSEAAPVAAVVPRPSAASEAPEAGTADTRADRRPQPPSSAPRLLAKRLPMSSAQAPKSPPAAPSASPPAVGSSADAASIPEPLQVADPEE